MPEARVESIDALKHLKAALVTFADGANIAINDAESEVVRTITWLENEQTSYWNSQHRKRTDMVSRCKEQVRMKKLFKDSSGRQQTAVEEEKALKVALRRLEESEYKIKMIQKAVQRLEKEYPLYKGNVQRFATDVQVEIPAAAAQLENMVRSLEAYVSMDAPVEVTSTAESVSTAPVASAPVASSPAGTSQAGSIARAIDEEKDKPTSAPSASQSASEVSSNENSHGSV